MTHRIARRVSQDSRPHFPFVVLQSALVQSSLPILRAFVNKRDAVSPVILFSLLYSPLTLVDPPGEGLRIVDMRAEVPGYSETRPDPLDYFSSIVSQGAMGSDALIPLSLTSALCDSS